MQIRHFLLAMSISATCLFSGCHTPAEKAARSLARRVVPESVDQIFFREIQDSTESYTLSSCNGKVLISGSGANALAAGLGRYLTDCCGMDISWYKERAAVLPDPLPLPSEPLKGKALVEQRFFLNYCTLGYTMPWWQWEDWEPFIDWMALNGVNLPLAITGQDAVLQRVWRRHGLSDDEIRAWFTGPAHLPWHRMCNIDGVDGPLPQGWIDGQAALQQKIVRRQRELGMRPVMPGFNGHVPGALQQKHPEAAIDQIKGWCGFPPENRPYFLSPTDSLFAVIQREFLEEQTALYGTDHVYGIDLFNEVEAPSWDPETLAGIARSTYASLAAADPDAVWLQMGWLFYNDSRHWTPENVKAYLQAVPQWKVVLLDYYTEVTPVWTLTDRFYGQPYIFCYLGNFGGNTRLAGPFRKMSERTSAVLSDGGSNLCGIGCTLEGFGINRWFYEYMLSRAWETGRDDNSWLESLDRRRHSPDGFWEQMADSIYIRGSFSENPLICGRPCLDGYRHWTVIHTTPYDNAMLVASWRRLLDSSDADACWKTDAVTLGCQALGNHFATLRDSLATAFRQGDVALVRQLSDRMRDLLFDVDRLAGCEPSFSLNAWLDQAESWGETDAEKAYYRRNAWHLITTWGDTPYLDDYAARLWSGLVGGYYAERWEIFFEELGSCLSEGRPYQQDSVDEKVRAFEVEATREAPAWEPAEVPADIAAYCRSLCDKWF